jgi:undecaprenyl diphosphate synthase
MADLNKLPNHIAIIMDGNGRWAKSKSLPRVSGHAMGAKRVTEIVQAASDLGIKALSLYAFSTENWTRPKKEVSALMELLVIYMRRQTKKLMKNKIRFLASGNLDELPAPARREILAAEEKTRLNPGMIFNLCVNYGGRLEIIDTCKKLAAQVATGQKQLAEIDEQTFAASLYHPELSEVDLLIRTSGETRISNFLIWQIAYAELYFTPVLWPDFTQPDLLEAINEYQQRERRFGGI